MKVLKFVGDKKYGYYIQEATISTYTILGDNRLCLRATEPEQKEMPKMKFVGGYPNEWYIFIDDLTDEEKSEITDIYGNSIKIQDFDI